MVIAKIRLWQTNYAKTLSANTNTLDPKLVPLQVHAKFISAKRRSV